MATHTAMAATHPTVETETAVDAPELFASQVGRDVPQRAWTVPVTVALHALVLAAVVVLPLLGDEVLPSAETGRRAFFVTPTYAPAPPPPPPPPAAAQPRPRPQVAPTETPSEFTAPTEVPEVLPDASALDLGIEGGVAGGVEGGVPGGVLGGVVGGLDTAPPPPPQPIRVGGQVSEPKKVKHVPPVYPDYAQKARIQGVVILECTISPRGQVQDVRVLRGIPVLDQAAVEAVRQWVYRPTLVNGVPTPVLMTVTVNFKLDV